MDVHIFHLKIFVTNLLGLQTILDYSGYRSIMEVCRENAMVLKKHLEGRRYFNILSKDNGVPVVVFSLKDRNQYDEFKILSTQGIW